VRHAEVKKYLAEGWTLVGGHGRIAPHHDQYAVLMEAPATVEPAPVPLEKGEKWCRRKPTGGVFERQPNNLCPTPPKALEPLLPYLRPGSRFCEPCAGAGHLIDALTTAGHVCAAACDTAPQRFDIAPRDALWLTCTDLIITNLPFDRSRSAMHAMIDHLPTLVPCWLLFDAAWPITARSAEHRRDLLEIVAIGRVQWIPGSKTWGTDDYCRFLCQRPRRQHRYNPVQQIVVAHPLRL
jgi:hypothetical protein